MTIIWVRDDINVISTDEHIENTNVKLYRLVVY